MRDATLLTPALTDAYVFLRRLEHRLQYLDDAQTHMLPDAASDRALLAESMGFPSWDALYRTLNEHRDIVSKHFQAVFADPNDRDGSQPIQAIWLGTAGNDAATALLSSLGYLAPGEILERIQRLTHAGRYQQRYRPRIASGWMQPHAA